MKELDNEIRKNLESKEQKNKLNEIREKYENKYINAAIMFFGTLIPLYLLFFGAMYIFMFFFGPALYLLHPYLGWMMPLIHGAIWVAAVISVYRNRSVLEDIIYRL
jgi:hypothetical protein